MTTTDSRLSFHRSVAAAVCDETNRVFAADWNGKLLAWKLEDGKVLKTLSANPPTLNQRLSQVKLELPPAQAKVNDAVTVCDYLETQISIAKAQPKVTNEQFSEAEQQDDK